MPIHLKLVLCVGLLALADATSGAPRLAPTPVFSRLGVADGLPSSVVYKVAQDRDGFVWFGTQDGLARYDGVGFRVWRNEPGNAGSLAGNEVSVLYVDRANQLWTGSEDTGLGVLDAGRRAFRHLRHDPDDPRSLPADDVWAITQDRSDAIWVGTYSGGLARLSRDGRHFDLHLRKDGASDTGTRGSLGSDTVLSLLATESGELWIGSDVGIDRRKADGQVEHVDLTAFSAGGRPLHVLAFAHESDAVLAATGSGLLRIDAQLRTSRVDAAGGARKLYGFAKNREGDFWLATRHGAVRRLPEGNEIAYGAQPLLPGGLPGEALFDVMTDRSDGLWLAALDGGVAYLPQQWRRFSQFRELPGSEDGLFHGRVAGLGLAADGKVWLVNSNDGLDLLDPSSGQVKHLNKFTKSDGMRLRAVHEDRLGRLWLGQQRGLRMIEPARDRVFDLPVDAARADALPAAMIEQFAEATDVMWINARGSCLLRVDLSSLAMQRFEPGESSGLSSTDVSQLLLSPSQQLWVAHDQGIDRFDPSSNRFVSMSGVPVGRVHALAFAEDGSLWAHRFGALEHFAIDGDHLRVLQRIDATSGWPALAAGGLVVDARSRLWVTTLRGLYRVDPSTSKVRHYDAGDGLLSPEFVDRSLRLRADGVLFAATLAGVVALDTNQPDAIDPAVALQWTRLSARRGEARVEFDPAGDIELRWNDRDLRIQTRALAFAGKKRYQFRLDGLERDWSEPTGNGERELAQLPAGDYQLRVRASVDAGVAEESIRPLRLRVASPPWATTAAYVAYALCSILLAGLLLGAWRRRIARVHELDLAQQRRALAEQTSAAKSDFLAHMGHEIRTPMTGLLGMTELLARSSLDERQRGYTDAIRSSGEQMLRLVNDALDLARIEAGRLELDADPFDPGALLREVGTVGIALAERKGIAFKWEYVDKDIPARVLGDARRIRQVLLNLVGNAVKFTSRGGVSLSLTRQDDGRLCWSVADSGPGVSADLRKRLFQRYEQSEGGRRAGGSGLGLAICRELCELMGGSIELDDGSAGGSVFRVILPLPVAAAPAVPFPLRDQIPVVVDVADPSLDLLLVEDDALAASAVSGLLQSLGHRVRHAENGLIAVSELERQRPHLAFVDLDMPGINGLQLARLWRNREHQHGASRLPLIALTGRSEGDTEMQVSSAGMDGLLRKPVDRASLAAILHRLLHQQAEAARAD